MCGRKQTSVDSLFKSMMKHIKTVNSSWFYSGLCYLLESNPEKFSVTVNVEVICNNLMVVYAFASMGIYIAPFKNLSKVLKRGCLTDPTSCYVNNAWNCKFRHNR